MSKLSPPAAPENKKTPLVSVTDKELNDCMAAAQIAYASSCPLEADADVVMRMCWELYCIRKRADLARAPADYVRGLEDAANLIQAAAWLAEIPVKGDEQRLMNTLQKGADAIRALAARAPAEDKQCARAAEEIVDWLNATGSLSVKVQQAKRGLVRGITQLISTAARAPQNPELQKAIDDLYLTVEWIDIKLGPKDIIQAAVKKVQALAARAPAAQKEIDAAWLAIHRGWDIEPRSYFEEQAPKNGFESPLAMAVHYMWKRELKLTAEDAARAPAPPEEQDSPRVERLQAQLEGIMNCLAEDQKEIAQLRATNKSLSTLNRDLDRAVCEAGGRLARCYQDGYDAALALAVDAEDKAAEEIAKTFWEDQR